MFRTEAGRIAVVDPYCPHLGHGGRVAGERIRCTGAQYRRWCRQFYRS